MDEEIRRATAIFRQSRQAVQSLLGEARMGQAVDAEKCLPLVADITASVWRNAGALVSLARLKTHDDYSYMHSVAVCALMVSLARQLGQNEDQAREAGLAGLLHDIGKAKMPLDLLNKPGKLTSHAISTVAKMGALCDVYDAITSNRPYKAGWDPAESVSLM